MTSIMTFQRNSHKNLLTIYDGEVEPQIKCNNHTAFVPSSKDDFVRNQDMVTLFACIENRNGTRGETVAFPLFIPVSFMSAEAGLEF